MSQQELNPATSSVQDGAARNPAQVAVTAAAAAATAAAAAESHSRTDNPAEHPQQEVVPNPLSEESEVITDTASAAAAAAASAVATANLTKKNDSDPDPSLHAVEQTIAATDQQMPSTEQQMSGEQAIQQQEQSVQGAEQSVQTAEQQMQTTDPQMQAAAAAAASVEMDTTPPRASILHRPTQITPQQSAMGHVPNMPPLVSPIQKKSSSAAPYICDVVGCGKAFSKKFNLKAHKRVHTGEEPFVCSFPTCGKTFKWKSSLTFHEGLHLNAPEEVPPTAADIAAASAVSSGKKTNKV